MPSLARLFIHSSQFPENVQKDLLKCLRERQVNHKFHYDSVKQTQKWLALHQAYSPSRTDPQCSEIYDRSSEAVTGQIQSSCVHLIGLGCGGGQKDGRLLGLLAASGKHVSYSPVDVSTAMVLVAHQATLGIMGEENCFPLVCDLATADDLPAVLDQVALGVRGAGIRITHHASRIITFFGMLPNFEPQLILPRLSALLLPGDYLLLSANLAPGQDYEAGVRRILPLYDNALTRDWLMTFLVDLGAEKDDGEVRFVIEDDAAGSGLKRVAANFHFVKRRELRLDQDLFEFEPGDSIRLFFSYRHTPALVRSLLAARGLKVFEEWITRSEEEGVFLVRRQPSSPAPP